MYSFKDYIDLVIKSLDHLYVKDESRAIAMRLLSFYLGEPSYKFIAYPQTIISNHKITPLLEAIDKLKEGVPYQYIVGYQEFYGFDFFVSPSVLIPRHETEELVLWALEFIKDRFINSEKKIRVLDLATGSGAISLSIFKEYPQFDYYAIDISNEALDVASKNLNHMIEKLALESYRDNFRFIGSDILDESSIESALRSVDDFHIIISNPPYVTNFQKKEMSKNVLDHEPHLALFVEDNNPLIFYKKIERIAEKYLKKEGALFLEINELYAKETSALFDNVVYSQVSVKKDINNKDRMIRVIK